MKNNTDLDTLTNNFVENVNEVIKPVTEAFKNIANALSIALLEAWKETKFSMDFFDKKISRKRFTKLLMSIGYQRNEANKLAWKYHKEKGKYTLLDFMIENKKKEEIK